MSLTVGALSLLTGSVDSMHKKGRSSQERETFLHVHQQCAGNVSCLLVQTTTAHTHTVHVTMS